MADRLLPQPALSRPGAGRAFAGLALLWLACGYFWVLPLLRPRGEYGWGHYRLVDFYVGIPLALATLAASLVALSPPRCRRPLALRLTSIAIAVLVGALLFDLAYVLGVRRIGRADYWLDAVGVLRTANLPDPELGYVRKPGLSWSGYALDSARPMEYRTDEHGFRNPPGAGAADLLFLGDSFTEGDGVAEAETFVQLVGAASGLRVRNLGVGGYGPPQELLVLQRHGLALKPRAVVWQIFEGNDLPDAERFAEWRSNPDQEVPSFGARYLTHSLFRRVLNKTARTAAAAAPAQFRAADGRLLPLSARDLKPYRPELPTQFPLGMAETERAIEAGYKACQARGIPLLVLFVPLESRVLAPFIVFDTPAERDRVLPGGVTQSPGDFGSTLGRFCRQLGCSYLDLYPLLSREARRGRQRLYILGDGHLDTAGHQRVADEIARWLRSQQVVGT